MTSERQVKVSLKTILGFGAIETGGGGGYCCIKLYKIVFLITQAKSQRPVINFVCKSVSTFVEYSCSLSVVCVIFSKQMFLNIIFIR